MIRRALLTVVLPVSFGYVVGCGLTLAEIGNVATSDEVPSALRKCRAEAREAFYDAGKSDDEALAVYDACKKDAGL